VSTGWNRRSTGVRSSIDDGDLDPADDITEGDVSADRDGAVVRLRTVDLGAGRYRQSTRGRARRQKRDDWMLEIRWVE